MLRIVGFIIIIFGLMFYLGKGLSDGLFPKDFEKNKTSSYELSDEEFEPTDKNFLPTSTTGQVVEHQYYTLSYSEDHEQAEWVAYELTKKSIQAPNVERTDYFEKDFKVSTRSAVHKDYSGSGYSRGHIAPAGDMAFNTTAMEESFFMSNMSPQVRNFNGGIWRELEETVRDWAYKNEKVYIVTGPVLTRGIVKKIGQNKVSVPSQFYKIIVDYTKPEIKSIAFLIPNEMSDKRLEDYVVSIDSIEELTEINFFADFFTEVEDEKLESSTSIDGWNFNENKYKTRVKYWNNQ